MKRIYFALFVLFACVTFFDAVALAIGRFDIDWIHYLGLLAFAAVFFFPAAFYARMRRDERLSAVFVGLSFLLAFAPACALICNLGSGIAGPRIDGLLAQFDRAIGFDWPALVAFSARHEIMNRVLAVVYALAVWQVFVMICILGWRTDPKEIGKLCIAIAISGIAASAFWLAFPSFGAVTVYWIPEAIATKVHATVDNAYGRHLIEVLRSGPGRIGPSAVKGLVGFPSFHTAEAVVITWYARNLKLLFVPFAAFNALNVLAALIQGGHHLSDVIGGAGVAAAAIGIAAWVATKPAPQAESGAQLQPQPR